MRPLVITLARVISNCHLLIRFCDGWLLLVCAFFICKYGVLGEDDCLLKIWCCSTFSLLSIWVNGWLWINYYYYSSLLFLSLLIIP